MPIICISCHIHLQSPMICYFISGNNVMTVGHVRKHEAAFTRLFLFETARYFRLIHFRMIQIMPTTSTSESEDNYGEKHRKRQG